ncbi:MAG: hypothetical protein P8X57_12725 [Cyclobacteriaceae bacterium]
MKPFLPVTVNRLAVGLTGLLSLLIGWYAIAHLPYIDFRPYKIGNSIPSNMIAEEEPIVEYTFINQEGEEVQSPTFLLPEDGYEYVEAVTLNEKESTPKITDYQVFDSDGNDYTEESFRGTKLLLIVQDVQKADTGNMDRFRTLVETFDGKIDIVAFTSSGPEAFEAFRHEHQLAIPYYFLDATVLKAMIRSNPGVMLLRNGIVFGKWHENDIPSPDELRPLL